MQAGFWICAVAQQNKATEVWKTGLLMLGYSELIWCNRQLSTLSILYSWHNWRWP